MRSSGPELSKARVSALIADGEITIEDVESGKRESANARAEKKDITIAGAKKNRKEVVAGGRAEFKEQRGTRRQPAKSASPPRLQKPEVPRTAQRLPPWKTTVTSAKLWLDEKTFEALKHRGSQFIVEDEASGIAYGPEPVQRPAARPRPVFEMASEIAEPGRTRPTGVRDRAGYASPIQTKPSRKQASGTSETQSPKPTADMQGRMGLGQQPASSGDQKPEFSFWNALVRFLTGDNR
jgi:hypothetical protein